LDGHDELLLADLATIGVVRLREEGQQMLDLLSVVFGLLLLVVILVPDPLPNILHAPHILLSGDVHSSILIHLLLVALECLDEEIVE